MISAILFSICIGGLIWYFITTVTEKRIIEDRTQRAFSTQHSASASKKNFELFNTGRETRKNLLGGMFNFPIFPSVQHILIFGGIWLGSTYGLFFKTTLPGGTKGLLAFLFAFVLLPVLRLATIRYRHTLIRKDLPGTLDLIVVCLEAGLGISAAFLRVANELGNVPLGDELRLTFNQINAGIPFEIGMRNFGRRCNLTEINALVVTVIQSQKMGTAMAKTFRVQSESIRELYRLKAKEEIMKIPIKILFPLVFFIFPALFVVILGPAVINIVKTFSNQN